MIPEVEVAIASKMATYAVDPYQCFSKVLKGGGGIYVYNEVEMNYCRLAKQRNSQHRPL